MSIPEKYEKNFLAIELGISIISAIIITALFLSVFSSVLSSPEFQKLLINPVFPVIATICVTLLGFIMTGVSVLISFAETGRMSLLRQSSQYRTLFDIFFSAIKFLAITALFAIIGIFSNGYLLNIVFYLTMWGVIISIFRTYRCIWALEEIIKLTCPRTSTS